MTWLEYYGLRDNHFWVQSTLKRGTHIIKHLDPKQFWDECILAYQELTPYIFFYMFYYIIYIHSPSYEYFVSYILCFFKVREALKGLELNNAAVWKMEKIRQQSPDHPDAPWFITGPYLALCWVLDVIYDKRPIERFWFLETVARMPYFAYISMLHLYESLGWWRAGAELRRVSLSIWKQFESRKSVNSVSDDERLSTE